MRAIPVGTLRITEIYKPTGEILSLYGPEYNMVTDSGVNELWERNFEVDVNNDRRFDTIHLGDDFGDPADWSVFNPEPAARDFTAANQNVTYVIPSVDYTFPTDDVMRTRAEIDGTTLMDTEFPNDVEFHYSSMTLRFNNGNIFAYKRFPVRSISREVSVIVDWRFTMVNLDDWTGG